MTADAKVPPARLARGVERVRHHLYRLHQRLVPAPVALSELVVGAWVAQAVQAAAELGIADAWGDGPLSIDELALRVEADPDALERLLRALLTRGVFRRRRDGRYCLTPLAATLRSDASASMAGVALLYASPHPREYGRQRVISVSTGRPTLPKCRG